MTTLLTRKDVERLIDEARRKHLVPNLYGANLRGADLDGVNLYATNLYAANLHGANLRDANLRRADLREADLNGADLDGANMSGADLSGTILLRLDGLPSGQATLVPTPNGWRLTVGCWGGTVQELRDLIAWADWPEADTDEERDRRRPGLALLADLCDDHIARHPDAIDELAKRWADKD